MSDNTRTPRRVKIALLGAGVAAGAIGAAAYSANAAGSNTTSPSSYQAPANGSAPSGAASGAPGRPQAGRPGGNHGSTPVRSDEKEVTGALAATLKAAALKAVPGATVYRVETDAGDGVYEAHMTKSDGSTVTVKFDKNGTVTAVEAGMGKGDPRPTH
jgi:hypothetical protein